MEKSAPESDAATQPVGNAPTLPASSGSQPSQVDPSPAPLDETPYAERYRIRALLGAGGMGEVHLGKDERIGREVAIKVARGGSGSHADAVHRFVREARVQGQLEHPSIVPVYDLGRRADGAVFFTMKRVRGLSLEQILDGLRRGDGELEKRYSRRKLLTAFSSVCLAVHFAHTRGVLHRDLKPANVMLGDFGEVYVLDWGLAKIVDAEDVAAAGDAPGDRVDSGPAGATTSGAVMGTPGYMPPEQVRGQVERFDPRVDVYSLGAVLFELLTLQPLHPRGTPTAAMASTLEGADARASVRAPDRDVPPELEAICIRATATDPAARFADARELHDAIERYLDGDRDLERRRQLADDAFRVADEAAERALSETGTEADRREALQKAGRALALDPNHPGAMRTMVRLLVAPPRELPAEVRAELDEAREQNVRVAARAASIGYILLLGTGPLLCWMGIRQVLPLVAWAVACSALVGVSLLAARSRRPTRRLHFLAVTFSCVTFALMAPTFSPYAMLPGYVTASVMGFLLSGRREHRALVIVTGLLALLVPMVAEWTGLVPTTTRVAGGAITISSWVIDYPPALTMGILSANVLALVLMPAVFVLRVRNALDRAEERLVVQSWHLRQLVPDQAHGALAPPPAPVPSCPLG